MYYYKIKKYSVGFVVKVETDNQISSTPFKMVIDSINRNSKYEFTIFKTKRILKEKKLDIFDRKFSINSVCPDPDVTIMLIRFWPLEYFDLKTDKKTISRKKLINKLKQLNEDTELHKEYFEKKHNHQ